MDNPTILVADGDPKNLQILRESLEASGFEVIVASDGLQAWQKISSDVPDLILSEVNLPKLDGFQLLEKLKADPVTSSIPLMFLTNRRELQDRVRSLRGGVKDYMIKPLHVKEVIARVRMILRRMERIREEEIESTRKLAGRLEEFSVIDLIENFGMERKTGILTLYNASNKSGEIYFRDGAVINASLANLKAEKAVYQMLPWKRGQFTMTFKEINVPDEIAVSNLGLLLHGFKRMEERERLFKMLPSPETTFLTTETFRNIVARRELTADVARFIALIDGKRDILQVIDESNYDDIKTLERLVKLYQQGFIKPSKTSLAGDEESADMVATLAEPKIIEKFDIETLESRYVGRPSEKEAPPQAFRAPERPAYKPPERRQNDKPIITIEAKQDPPIAPPPAIAPPSPPTELIGGDDFQIDLDTFGEDAPPEEPFPKIKNRLGETPAPTTAVEIISDYVPPPTGIKPPTVDTRKKIPASPPPPEPVSSTTEVLPIEPAPAPAMNTRTILVDSPAEMEKVLARLQKTAESMISPASPTVIEPVQLRSEPVAPTQPPREPIPIATLAAPTVIEPIQLRSEPVAPTQPPREPIPIVTPAAPTVIEPVQLRSEPVAPTQPPREPIPLVTPAAPTVIEPVIPEQTQIESFMPSTPPPALMSPMPPPAEPVAPPVVPPAASQPAETITVCLTQLLKNRPAAKPKLVIIGRDGQHVSPMLRHMLGAESSLRRMQSAVFQYLEIGERKIESQPFEIIGISMEQQFTRLLDTAGPDLLGYIVMIEAHRKERLEYLSYLVNMLNNVYRRPLGIGIIKSPDQKNMSPDTLRDLLNIGATDFLQECTPTDKISVTEFLKGFTSEANLPRWSLKETTN